MYDIVQLENIRYKRISWRSRLVQRCRYLSENLETDNFTEATYRGRGDRLIDELWQLND